MDANNIINIEFNDIFKLNILNIIELSIGINATIKHIKLAEPKNPINTFFLENASFKWHDA